jgi:prenyltransferase beta subunit
VPGEGRYGKTVERGIDYILSIANKETGYIVETRTGSHGGMYCHGTSTLMLAEAVGMVSGERGKKIREVLEKAVKLTLKAQALPRESARQQGGWRYEPGSRDSDLSCTGWQLMSLRAAKNAGADVPIEAINQGVQFVKACASGGGGFGYQPGGGPNNARTGTGILSLEVCGQHNTPEAIAGADWLMKNPPHWPDEFFYYAVYYDAQGMFQMGDKYWDFYRPRLEALLLGLQKDDGSWPTPTGSEARAGNTYSTAMAVLSLSVKYHYLPIYQRGE